jgi:putative membrane protein insertion efficiency factor
MKLDRRAIVALAVLLLWVAGLGYDLLCRAPSEQFSAQLLVWAIRGYQMTLSPVLARCGVHCRYQPTCSEYAILVLKEYGTVKGIWIAGERLVTCH